MQKQFKIEAWDQSDPVPPISHRNQLQPLQQILQKAKYTSQKIINKNKSRRLVLDTLQSKGDTSDEESYFSTKSKKRKFHTEHIQIKKGSPSKGSPKRKPEIVVHQQFPLQNYNHSQGSRQLVKNIATLIEREPPLSSKSPKYILRHIKTIPSSSKPQIRSHSFHAPFQNKSINAAKKHQGVLKIKKLKKTKVNSEACLVVHPRSDKEEELKVLKTQFLKMIQGSHNINQLTQGKDKEYKPANDYRWKKIVRKSQRKKEDLDEIFKTRPLLKKKQHMKEVNQQKKKINLEMSLEKAQGRHISKLIPTQFDDASIYNPWSSREIRSTKQIHHPMFTT